MSPEPITPLTRRAICRTFAFLAGVLILGSTPSAWAQENKETRLSGAVQRNATQPKFTSKVL